MSAQVDIAFFGTSRSGLGHLRRICNIASRVAARRPGIRLALVTNAQPAGLTAEDISGFAQIVVCGRADMAGWLCKAGVSLAVLDTMHLPGLQAFDGRAVLILRETPAGRIDSFRREDGRPWDCVLVPNAADHWMPPRPPGFTRKTEAAGWILRRTGPRTAKDGSTGIVLATGGGGTPETRETLYPLLSRVIATARLLAHRRFRVRQALGPRAAGQTLPGVDEVFDPGGSLNDVFRAADLVISTAGYNSVLELASTDTPALIAPIPRSLDDQAARVRLWGARLGHGLAYDGIEAAAAWLADQVDRPRRRAPVDLGPDGATRAADILLDMLCPVS